MSKKTGRATRLTQADRVQGGKSRAKKYSHRKLSQWGKMGGDGRPPVATDAIIKAMQAGKKSPQEIAMESRVNVGTVMSLLTRLRKAGKVIRQGRGVWVLVDDSPKPQAAA